MARRKRSCGIARRASDDPGYPLDEEGRAGHRVIVGVDDRPAHRARRREDERDVRALPLRDVQLGAGHRPVGIVIGRDADALGAHVGEGEPARRVGLRVVVHGVRDGRRDEADGCPVHCVAIGIEDAPADLRRAVFRGRRRRRHRGGGGGGGAGRRRGRQLAHGDQSAGGDEEHERDEERGESGSGGRRGHRAETYRCGRLRARPAAWRAAGRREPRTRTVRPTRRAPGASRLRRDRTPAG